MNTMKLALAGATGMAALALGGCATLEEGLAETFAETYYSTLSGASVPGGGDADGSARAEISVTDEFDQVCWDINEVRNLGTVTGAHIHMGAAGTNGPVVFTLEKSNEGTWKGCKDGGEWTENRIENNPSMFYVQVHTSQYPNGAIRGQLANMGN